MFMEALIGQQETDITNERAVLNDQVESLLSSLSSNWQSLEITLVMKQAPRDETEFLVFDGLVWKHTVFFCRKRQLVTL